MEKKLTIEEVREILDKLPKETDFIVTINIGEDDQHDETPIQA